MVTWDEAKRKANLRKHGSDFADAQIHMISMRKATRHERETYFEDAAN